MAMQYINYLKSKTRRSSTDKQENPILSEEDEKFLNRITSGSHGDPTQLPVAGEIQIKDAQIALMDGAQNVPLPETPKDEPKEISTEPEHVGESAKEGKAKKRWNWLRRDSRDARRKNQEATAADLKDAAEIVKSAEAKPNEDHIVEDVEAHKEVEDMAMALERLNLAAVNNRVFSVSEETQELLQKFNQIFKDLINGAPTAYDDLERLLTNSDRQLQSTFKSLPSFLQKLVEQLPEKMTKGFAPEIMTAAAERAQKSGVNVENAGKAAAAASKMGFKTPSLKDLIGKPGAVAGVLRSIIQFLRARFPAFMGMNVLWSMALFVLLLVFWYCHKRGKEIRWEKERELNEDEVARLDEEWKAQHPGERFTTTAEEGASIGDIKAGMERVRDARNGALTISDQGQLNKPSSLGTTIQAAEKTGT